MNTHSGNASDKSTILEAIKSLKSALRPERNGSRSERKTNKKTDNEMDIFQVSGNYRTYNAEKRENKVRNTEYGRDSLENIESHGRQI
jgi:hypothetical protein